MFLDAELATIALCWRIERRDGVAVGLTAHDRDLVVDGLVHRAAPGMTPSAIQRADGLEADTMDVAGALTSAAIGERDLLGGRWDGARVVLFAVDWTDPVARVELGEGIIGAVELGDDGFTAELRGASAALDRPVVEETSPECRACRVLCWRVGLRTCGSWECTAQSESLAGDMRATNTSGRRKLYGPSLTRFGAISATSRRMSSGPF